MSRDVGSGLAGVVAEDQFGDAGVYGTDLDAAIQAGNAQVGVPLDFLPVGFEFVLVTQFVE